MKYGHKYDTIPESDSLTGGVIMRNVLVSALVVIVLVLGTIDVMAEAWWEFAPPIITGPAPNTAFGTNVPILHAWVLDPAVNMAIVSGYEVQFANALPYAVGLFIPANGGGTCDWDAVRWFTSQSFTVDHQMNHEPIYWRVRVLFSNGHRSNWAIGYYKVGDYASFESPPTILGPPIANYDRGAVPYEWTAVPGAVSYDIAFAASYCNTVNLLYDLRDMENEPCKANVHIAYTTGTAHSPIHDCIHLPIYFMVRARFGDESTTNWAITYHNMYGGNNLSCGECYWPVGTEESTWGKIKSLHR